MSARFLRIRMSSVTKTSQASRDALIRWFESRPTNADAVQLIA
jgi:hypothetical protein